MAEEPVERWVLLLLFFHADAHVELHRVQVRLVGHEAVGTRVSAHEVLGRAFKVSRDEDFLACLFLARFLRVGLRFL